MQCALYVPNFGTFGDVATTVELARAAEAAGWDGLFVWDHLLPDADNAAGPVADPWVLLTAIAAATRRLRIGPLVTPLPRRRPAMVARATATLDQFSGGRLTLGVGIGGDWWREYSGFGEAGDAVRHGAMLDEGLNVLARLWSGETVSFAGTHYTLDGVRFLPTPAQQPRIPVWVAGVWPGTRPFRRAAQWDGVVPIGRHGDLQPEDVRAMLDYIGRHRGVAAPFDVVLSGRAHDRPAEAAGRVADYAAAGVTWWLEGFWGDEAAPEAILAIIERGPPNTW